MNDFDVDEILSKLTTAEKVRLLAGKDFWHTHPLPRLDIPSVRFSDGPNGVRGTQFFNGAPAACFPCGTALGATWDTELLRRCGNLMSEEASAKGVHVILGPTINTQRSPLGGRGFESISEDPVLSGVCAGALVRGMEEKGTAATLKHYVANDLEHERTSVSVEASERALREIYLMAFQVAIRECAPSCVMTSYNRVNGLHVSESKKFIEDILRKEWQWRGLVMSDWFGTYSTSEAINAGLDLEMPGPSVWREGALAASIEAKKVQARILDERVRNVLELVKRTRSSNPAKDPSIGTLNDTSETTALLREVASNAVVLLKNEKATLPFDPKKTIAVIGPNAKTAVYCGGGSASLPPYRAVTPFDGIASMCGSPVKYTIGAHAYRELPFIAPQLVTDDGKPGVWFRAYNDPPSVQDRKPFDELHKTDGLWYMGDYHHPNMNADLWYATVEGILIPEEDCEYDFSMAVSGTAKLFLDDQLVVDNETVQRPGESFFGTGTKEEIGRAKLARGKRHRIRIDWGCRTTMTFQHGGGSMHGGGLRVGAAKVLDADEEIERAVSIAQQADQVVLCVGLNSDWESEGYDRTHMNLPGRQDDLIAAVCAANPRTAVVLQSGTPVAMPWISKAPAILQAWYGGNETGNAIADVLFGVVNPSGKLPLSFPLREEDNPAFLNQRSEAGRMVYGEGVYVGYRYYQKAKQPVLFPFGHGLSYATFRLEELDVHAEGDSVVVRVSVVNTGSRAGAEVVQVYIASAPAGDSVTRPPLELKGFSKIHLAPGAKGRVEISLQRKYATSYWNEREDAWVEEMGTYKVFVGNTSDLLDGKALEGSFNVAQRTFWRGI